MKTALVLVLSFAAMAADPKPKNVKSPVSPQSEVVKKLGSVTWDLNTHKLVWVVQKGTVNNGEFKAVSEERYEISPDEAVMAVSRESRGFDDKEAASLHRLLDVLSLYCAESVVWWDEGLGKPVDSSTQPTPAKKPSQPATPSEQKPVRVGQPQQEKPVFRVAPGDIIARTAAQ